MLTYQRSKICSPQSCSQSVDGDEGAFEALHFAAYEQLWLTYKAMCSEPLAVAMTTSEHVYEVRPRGKIITASI